MRHNKGVNGGGSSLENSSGEEDEGVSRIESFIEDDNDNGVDMNDDSNENSQDFTQLVPQSSSRGEAQAETSRRRKSDKVTLTSSMNRPVNGYRIREVDETELPPNIIANMTRIIPNESDTIGGLTAEDVEAAASNSKGGIYILQCPANISLSNLLTGKKLSLKGSSLLADNDEEAKSELKQYVPKNSLGHNIQGRKYEAVSVKNEDEGMMLLLPDNGSFKLVRAPVSGHIMIREAIEDLSIPNIAIPKSKPRDLPAGVKERHPVYGADFSKILEQMEHQKVKTPKKKKKKSFKVESIHANSWQNGSQLGVPYIDIKQEIFSPDEDAISNKTKKKKKNKHGDTEDVFCSISARTNGDVGGYQNNDNSDLDGHCKQKKKSKKRKRGEELNETLDSDQTDILLTSTNKKSKKAKYSL